MPGFHCHKPQSPSTTVSPHKKTISSQREKCLSEKASNFSSSLKPKRPQHSQDGVCDASSTSSSQCDAREIWKFEQCHRKGQKMSIINQGTKPSGHSVIHFDKRFLQSFPQRQIKNRQQLYKTKESEKNKLEIYEDSHRDDPGCMTYGNWYKVLWREWKKQAKRIVSSEADAGSSSDESISDEKEIFHNNKKSSFDTRDTRRPSDSRNKLNKHFVTNENLAFPSSEDVEVKIESWDKVTYSKIVPAVQPCLILKSKIIYINPLTPDVFSHVSIQNHMEKVQSEGKAGTKTSGQIAVTKTAGQIAVTKTSGQIRKLMLLKEEHQAKRQKVQMKHGRLLEILKDSEKEKNGKKYYVIKHQEKMKKNKKFVRYTVSTKECIKHHKGRESTRLIPEQMSDDWLNCLPEEVRNKFINRSKSIHPEDSSAHFKLLEDITNTSEKTGEKPKKAEEILENASDRGRHGDDLNVSLESTGASKLSAIRPINHPYIFSDHHRVTYDSQEDSRIGMPGFSWYKVPGRELKKQAKRLTSSEADTDRSRDESMYLDTHFTKIPSDSRNKLKKHFVPKENLALPSLEGVEVKIESWDRVTFCKILPSSIIQDSDCLYKYPLTPAVSPHDITPNQIEVVPSQGTGDTNSAGQTMLLFDMEKYQAERQKAQIKVDNTLKDTETEINENYDEELQEIIMALENYSVKIIALGGCIEQLKGRSDYFNFDRDDTRTTLQILGGKPLVVENMAVDMRFKQKSTRIKLYRNIIRNETERMMSFIDMIEFEAKKLFGLERTRLFFDLLKFELSFFGSSGAISDFVPNMAESIVRQHVISFFEQACDTLNRLMTLLLSCPDGKLLQKMTEQTFIPVMQSVIDTSLKAEFKRGERISLKGSTLIMIDSEEFMTALGDKIHVDVLDRLKRGEEMFAYTFVDTKLERTQESERRESRPIHSIYFPSDCRLFVYIPTEHQSYWHQLDMQRANRIRQQDK